MTNRIRVGIADDDAMIRIALNRALSRAEDLHVVAAVENGAAAVALARAGAIDVAILDFEMPEMDGFEALKTIRMVAPDVRVIMYSSHSAEQRSAQMLDAGARAYLQKPCSFERLVQTVRDVSQA